MFKLNQSNTHLASFVIPPHPTMDQADQRETAQTNETDGQVENGAEPRQKRTGSPILDTRNTRQRNEGQEVTIKDENLPYLRELRKMYITKIKAEKQINHYTMCINTRNTPKQLIPKITPNTPTKPIKLLIDWQRALINTGQALTKTLLTYYNEYYEKIDEDIKQLTKDIKDNIVTDEADLIIRLCEENAEKFIQTLSQNVKKRREKDKEMQKVRQENN